MCAVGSTRNRAARLLSTAAASASLAASARPDTMIVRSMSERVGGSAAVRHFAETLTSSGSPLALRILRAVHASSDAIETTKRSSGLGGEPITRVRIGEIEDVAADVRPESLPLFVREDEEDSARGMGL